MEKIYCLLLFIISLNLNAQMTEEGWEKASKMFRKDKAEIWDDAINSEGERVINCSVRLTKSIKHEIALGLCATKILDEEKYLINFIITKANQPIKVKQESPILIKLGDDSVLTKTVFYSHEFIPKVSSLLGVTATIYTTNFCVDFTEEEILLLEKGVKKFRLEVNNDKWDVEMKKDNISQFLLDEYKLIKESLSKDKNFTDDF